MDAATSPVRRLGEAVESIEVLDAPGRLVGSNVRKLLPPGAFKDVLSGTPIGHALHPLLTDVVIGSFVSASLLDVLGGDDDGDAAERLLAVGIAAYGPTALTGVSDWADSEIGDERVRRVGLVHAVTNGAALGLYVASLAARRKGDRGRGKLLALAGGGVMGFGGYLGGHMTLARGVGANQTVFDAGPSDWTAAGSAADLAEGQPARVVVDDTPVMLVRHSGAIHAIHDRCSHRGCSLSAMGELDGSVLKGPATADQPANEVRESGGAIELRLS